MADSDGRAGSPRRARRRGILQHGSRMRSVVAGVVGVTMASTTLAACTSASAGTGPVTLNFYSFNDPSGAVAQAVAKGAAGCTCGEGRSHWRRDERRR